MPPRMLPRRALTYVAAGLFLAAATLAGWMLVSAARLPQDAPLAQMYRAEAGLAALMKAVETYQAAYGAYPPAGREGLRQAAAHLSGAANFLPDGPPLDPWGRDYVYAPSREYDVADSLALRDESGFYSAQTYQLYSMGADGDPGIDQPGARRDNISNWDPEKPWRSVYKERNRLFMRERRRVP